MGNQPWPQFQNEIRESQLNGRVITEQGLIILDIKDYRKQKHSNLKSFTLTLQWLISKWNVKSIYNLNSGQIEMYAEFMILKSMAHRNASLSQHKNIAISSGRTGQKHESKY